MHMEPEIVTGSKMLLGYPTDAGAIGYGALALKGALSRSGLVATIKRAAAATGLVFFCFEVLPHHLVGVSEAHLILGSTLYLLFGVGPAVFGFAAGLLIQGIFFAPFDLPQYGMNVTTLLVPLFGVAAFARRVIPSRTAYVDLRLLGRLPSVARLPGRRCELGRLLISLQRRPRRREPYCGLKLLILRLYSRLCHRAADRTRRPRCCKEQASADATRLLPAPPAPLLLDP